MYKEEKTSWMKHFDFIVLDILILQIAFNIGYLLRMETGWLYLNKEYTRLSIVLILIGICVGFFLEGYSGVLRRGYFIEFKETVKYVSLSSGFLIIYLFLVKNSDTYSRLTIFHLWWLGIILDYIARIGLKTYLKKKQASKARAVLIITTEEQAEENAEQLKEHAYAGIYPIGIAIVGVYSGTETIAGIPVIGKETEVLSYITGHVVDEIYINTSREVKLESEVEKYIEAGVTVHINLLETKGIAGYKCMEDFAGETVLTMTFKSATARQLLMKRMLDICGGLVGVMMMGIIFLFVAPIIKKQSPGPVFFSQWRIGRNGRKFKIYKFRSMYMDAEERKKELMKQNRVSDGLMFKMENDPRVIGSEKGPGKGIGNFIRKTSLDEFPQFFNVLKGDMSLVGTRPPTVDEWEKYELHHRARLAIKPGLTGMWQVSGRSEITDFEEVVKLDTKYISEWSFMLDIKILFKTVLIVLGQKGSM